jgi:threonylcarbamoyladenosine tRNA methylthiotransferase MtaB
MGKSFRIITLGCKVNQYESAHLDERLTQCGWSRATEGADVTVVNTCIVTHRAAYQSRQAIRKAIRENPDGLTAAIGCYGQVFPEDLESIDGLDLISGNAGKERLQEILANGAAGDQPRVITRPFSDSEPFAFLPIKGFQDRTRAFVKIQDGCESFCSYCIVPFARGPSRSLDAHRVITMLHELGCEGFQEAVLTGIHLGRYGADLNPPVTLTGLLENIGRAALPLRIRLSSLEPNEIGPDLISMMASREWLCRHFHIPLQSGDNRVLERMNRPYRARDFSSLIEEIHRSIPQAAIGVDTMAGFPGEGQQAFENTFTLLEGLPVSYLHVFPYSPRKGTAAASFPDRVDDRIIKERTSALRAMGNEKRQAFYRGCLGKTFRVLTEGWDPEDRQMIKGLSDNYLPIFFPSSEPMKNRMVSVHTERVEDGRLIGRIIFGPP